MSEVKRWDFCYYNDAPHDSGMELEENGEYVDYSDYAKLEAENENLKAQTVEDKDEIAEGERTIEFLERKIEKHIADKDALRAELAKVKRETIRVDVLLRWMTYAPDYNDRTISRLLLLLLNRRAARRNT